MDVDEPGSLEKASGGPTDGNSVEGSILVPSEAPVEIPVSGHVDDHVDNPVEGASGVLGEDDLFRIPAVSTQEQAKKEALVDADKSSTSAKRSREASDAPEDPTPNLGDPDALSESEPKRVKRTNGNAERRMSEVADQFPALQPTELEESKGTSSASKGLSSELPPAQAANIETGSVGLSWNRGVSSGSLRTSFGGATLRGFPGAKSEPTAGISAFASNLINSPDSAASPPHVEVAPHSQQNMSAKQTDSKMAGEGLGNSVEDTTLADNGAETTPDEQAPSPAEGENSESKAAAADGNPTTASGIRRFYHLDDDDFKIPLGVTRYAIFKIQQDEPWEKRGHRFAKAFCATNSKHAEEIDIEIVTSAFIQFFTEFRVSQDKFENPNGESKPVSIELVDVRLGIRRHFKEAADIAEAPKMESQPTSSEGKTKVETGKKAKKAKNKASQAEKGKKTKGESGIVSSSTVKSEMTIPSGEEELEQQHTYFPSADAAAGLACVFCARPGHKAAECPALGCNACGLRHHVLACPFRRRCGKCRQLGHDASACREKLKATAADGICCALCDDPAHLEGRCQRLWRSWEAPLTSEAGGAEGQHGAAAVPVHKVNYLPSFCSSCGAQGHFGPECLARQGSRPAVNGDHAMWSSAMRACFLDPAAKDSPISWPAAPNAHANDAGPGSLQIRGAAARHGGGQPAKHIYFGDSDDDDDNVGGNGGFIRPRVRPPAQQQQQQQQRGAPLMQLPINIRPDQTNAPWLPAAPSLLPPPPPPPPPQNGPADDDEYSPPPASTLLGPPPNMFAPYHEQLPAPHLFPPPPPGTYATGPPPLLPPPPPPNFPVQPGQQYPFRPPLPPGPPPPPLQTYVQLQQQEHSSRALPQRPQHAGSNNSSGSGSGRQLRGQGQQQQQPQQQQANRGGGGRRGGRGGPNGGGGGGGQQRGNNAEASQPPRQTRRDRRAAAAGGAGGGGAPGAGGRGGGRGGGGAGGARGGRQQGGRRGGSS